MLLVLIVGFKEGVQVASVCIVTRSICICTCIVTVISVSVGDTTYYNTPNLRTGI